MRVPGGGACFLASSTKRRATSAITAERFFGKAPPQEPLDDYLVKLYFEQKRINEQQWIAAVQFRQDFVIATWDYRHTETQHPGWTFPLGPQFDSEDRVKRALCKVPENCSAVLLAVCGLGCGLQRDQEETDEEIELLSIGLDALADYFQREAGNQNRMLQYLSTWLEESKFEQLGRRYSIIPNRAVSDQRLNEKAFRLLGALGTYCDREGWCRLSNVTLANRTGLAPRGVIEGLQSLQDAGYLEASQQSADQISRSRRYKIRYDTVLPALENPNYHVSHKRRGRKTKPGARLVAFATRYLHWRLREAGSPAPLETAIAEISDRTGISAHTIDRWIRPCNSHLSPTETD
jgi:hypothetical protein